MTAPYPPAPALATLLIGAGVTHFAVPAFYDAMIPEFLPGSPRVWTRGSGVLELAVGTAVLVPRTRRAGALAAAALFAAVLPGNVKMAIDARRSDSVAYRAGTILRLPAQAPLIGWALRVRSRA
ncbi:MauE/DoxX family redox-associated membrane protein [uncultured Jatrophihabitans sp.]|uniref:DoxX family protein n=1 Tax=uncultured Jatrophihabitans sp. TaxID=1610747 RepID=UPI0035CB097B